MSTQFYPTEDKEQGFTLVELLVVIIIIGILAAIAIPAFLNQRQRANDAAVQSDVKNAATAVETALVDDPNATVFTGVILENDSNGYLTVGNNDKVPVTKTKGVRITLKASKSGTNGYSIFGQHINGKKYVGQNWLVYDSNTGGIQSSTSKPAPDSPQDAALMDDMERVGQLIQSTYASQCPDNYGGGAARLGGSGGNSRFELTCITNGGIRTLAEIPITAGVNMRLQSASDYGTRWVIQGTVAKGSLYGASASVNTWSSFSESSTTPYQGPRNVLVYDSKFGGVQSAWWL